MTGHPTNSTSPEATRALLDIADAIKAACANGYLADRFEGLADIIVQQPAAERDEPWCPDVCPITDLPFFMWIEHHKSKTMVPTYGGPFDSYTIPVRDESGSYCRERYDHDNGWWVVDEIEDVGVQIVSDQAYVSDEPPSAQEQAETPTRGQLLEALAKIKLRITFIGWPAESMWNVGTDAQPRWVPDWRYEAQLIEHLLNGAEITASEKPTDTKPANEIHQPQAVEPVAHLWKHSQTGRTRIVTPGGLITADACWFVVGPLILANTSTQPVRQPLTLEQKAYFVDEICALGTGLVTPLFAIVEAIERAAIGITGSKT